MKTRKEKTNARIHFVRVYSFYISQKNESFSFQVTLKCYCPLNKMTGMSVNLTDLDLAAKLFFKNEVNTSNSLTSVLQKKVKQISSHLRKQKVKLISVYFDECRQFGIHFTEQRILFVRRDMARSSSGDLYEVFTHLDSKQTVVQLGLKNLKTKITEQIIF